MMDDTVTVRAALPSDLACVLALSCALWPDNDRNELEAEFAALLLSDSARVFLAYDNGEAVGFAQCELRSDYVEGSDSSPVGYLEGIYVAPAHRLKGVARALTARCEAWAAANGCTQFASDCELENIDSLRFHLKAGFNEANRIICFIKDI